MRFTSHPHLFDLIVRVQVRPVKKSHCAIAEEVTAWDHLERACNFSGFSGKSMKNQVKMEKSIENRTVVLLKPVDVEENADESKLGLEAQAKSVRNATLKSYCGGIAARGYIVGGDRVGGDSGEALLVVAGGAHGCGGGVVVRVPALALVAAVFDQSDHVVVANRGPEDGARQRQHLRVALKTQAI